MHEDEPRESDPPDVNPFALDPLMTRPLLELPALLRAVRHHADLSQRELAAQVGVSKSHIGDLESGRTTTPSYPLVLRIVAVAGLKMQVLDAFAMPLMARPHDGVLDKGYRHWPAHLDTRAVLTDGDWWYSRMKAADRPLPAFTADWRRLHGRRRSRRPKAQRIAESAARRAADTRNTPPRPEVKDLDRDDG